MPNEAVRPRTGQPVRGRRPLLNLQVWPSPGGGTRGRPPAPQAPYPVRELVSLSEEVLGKRKQEATGNHFRPIDAAATIDGMATRQHSGTAADPRTHRPDARGLDTGLYLPHDRLRNAHGGPALRDHPRPAEGVRNLPLNTPGTMKTAEPANSTPFSYANFRQHLVLVTAVRPAGRHRIAKES